MRWRLFMFILKDPGRARAMGLIGAKAQITAGTADRPTYFGVIAQAEAVGGSMLFPLSHGVGLRPRVHRADRQAHNRAADVASGRGDRQVHGRGRLEHRSLCLGFRIVLGYRLARRPARLADGCRVLGHVQRGGDGRAHDRAAHAHRLHRNRWTGYLAPVGFAILMVFLAQILAVMRWGAWFPWSVAPLFAGIAGPRGAEVGIHSCMIVGATR
jgi:ABC-2 type transport system permease protein